MRDEDQMGVYVGWLEGKMNETLHFMKQIGTEIPNGISEAELSIKFDLDLHVRAPRRKEDT